MEGKRKRKQKIMGTKRKGIQSEIRRRKICHKDGTEETGTKGCCQCAFPKCMQVGSEGKFIVFSGLLIEPTWAGNNSKKLGIVPYSISILLFSSKE